MDPAGRPNGLPCGRGRVTTTDQGQALENGVEHAGLEQDRHALVVRLVDMSWEWPRADQRVLRFSLQAGGDAAAALNEILRTTAPDRHTERAVAAGA